jgi:cytochrome c oxidase subunit 2
MRPIPILFALVALAAAPSGAAAEDRGEQLFQLCAQCHGPEGAGDPLALAPAIGGMDLWFLKAQLGKFRSGARGMHFDDIAGMRMRPMALSLLSEEEVAEVAAYVAALPVTVPTPTLDGDPVRGQALYAPCSACHGADGKGIEALNGSPLRGASDWYLFRQMQNFRSGVRGTRPGDASGALMRPMSMTLPDDQAIKDVIAYITTLSGSK